MANTIVNLTSNRERTTPNFRNADGQTKDPWIPCSERLPKLSGYYMLTVVRPDGVRLVIRNYFSKTENDWAQKNVLAWMEEPAPWQGEVK
jgi:hypothetical protein